MPPLLDDAEADRLATVPVWVQDLIVRVAERSGARTAAMLASLLDEKATAAERADASYRRGMRDAADACRRWTGGAP